MVEDYFWNNDLNSLKGNQIWNLISREESLHQSSHNRLLGCQSLVLSLIYLQISDLIEGFLETFKVFSFFLPTF